MRQDIYQMWSIQESLLQQYRGLAITLMGLIAAGILVAMSRLSDGWDQLSGLLPAILAGEATLRALADLAIFAMMVTLLVLGIRAGIFFRKITGQRARFVTFYQNLLLAEENGQ
jgi:predicted exporter